MKHRFDEIAINITTKKKPTENDKYHYIGLEHIDSDCLTISRYGSDVAPIGEKLVMQKGDILFGKRRAYQRKVGIAPFDGIFSAHGMVLRPNEDIVNKDFFPFFISSDQFMETAVRISVGGLSPTINWKDLREQVFELPSLSIQADLANKLWAAYRLKESYKRLLTATDEMVKSQFIEMFGEYPTMVKVVDVAKASPGKSLPLSIENEGGSIAYVKVADFNLEGNERKITISSRYVSGNTSKASVMVPIGTTIFAKNGAAALSNKKRITDIPCCIDMNTMALYSISNSLHPEFLYAFCCSKDISKLTLVGAIPQIRPKDVLELDIPLPPIEEQKRYVSILQHADKSKFELRKSIEAIDKVIKSLINN